MLRFCDRLLRVNNRCVVRARQAHFGSKKRSGLSQVVKFDRKESAQHKRGPKSRFTAFGHDSKHYDKPDPDADLKFDIDDDEDYDDQILHAHEKYDEYKSEEKWRHESMVWNIIKKKYFKEPQEPSLLTWAAKEQLRYLHDTDEETWTPERLAESFPISVSGVKKLLASSYRIHTEGRILAHDKAVYDRWKQLRKDGGPILSALHPKFSSRDRDLVGAKVNCNLPMPDKAWQMQNLPQKSETTARSDAPIGEFENLIVQYKNLVEKPKTDSTELTLAPDETKVAKYGAPPEAMESFSPPAPSLQNASQPVTFDQFKKNMMHHLLTRSIDNPEPYEKLKTWLKENDTSMVPPEPPPIEELLEDPMVDLFNGKVKKYKDAAAPDVMWDVHRDAKNPEAVEAYIYEPKRGYQRPYGRFEDGSRIKIPRSEWKEGALYRKDDCYYDDTGEFLYRVPFPMEK